MRRLLQRWRPIPFVPQLGAADCGAACLAMVLRYHGQYVGLDELRERTDGGRDGATAQTLALVARAHGLRARGFALQAELLGKLPPASILHWEGNHFVVLERVRGQTVYIVDPAFGRCTFSLEEARQLFSGVALVFEAGEDFVRRSLPASERYRWLPLAAKLAPRLGPVLLLSGLGQLSALAVPFATSALVERVIPSGEVGLLASLAGGLLAFVALQLGVALLRGHLLATLRTRLDADLTRHFMEHLLSLPYAFFQRRSTGDLMTRVGSNAILREILTSSALTGLLDAIFAIVQLVALVALDPSFALLALGLASLQVLLLRATHRRRRDLHTASLRLQAREQSAEIEMLAGIETLKAMGAERASLDAWTRIFAQVLEVVERKNRLDSLVESASATLQWASPLILLSYGALCAVAGSIQLGPMLASAGLGASLVAQTTSLLLGLNQLAFLAVYAERIHDVLDTSPEQQPARRRTAPPLQGAIALEGVSFRYGAYAPLVLEEVSAQIEPGQLVAIIGRSGSGKSTLAHLLAGLYPPSSGRVRFDGHDLAELELGSLRRQLGVVTQQAHLFAGTLRSNIALADPDAPMEAIERAARAARIHDDIVRMPMGYATPIDAGGSQLSGGQRQRIALARALLHKPRVLVLDEATSALDAVTEAEVFAEIAQLACTRVVIAHRLSTITRADRILVLREGRLVEAGTHRELMARGGHYAELVGAQVGRGETLRPVPVPVRENPESGIAEGCS